MSVKINEDGSRSVEVEVEVPGTPDEVWRAIATGPGISSWFVPTELEGKVGGEIVQHFGEGMDDKATIRKWEPPHRFVAEGVDWPPGAPPLATEWTVEARDGGHCVVRVVHSLFATSDEWDNQLEGTESGWPFFFRILRLVLTHYKDQRCVPLQLMAVDSDGTPEAHEQTWKTLIGDLGLTEACASGDAFQAPSSVPALRGEVDLVQAGPQKQLLARIDEPAPGFATASVCGPYTAFGLSLFGDDAEARLERDAPAWREWFAQFTPPAPEA